MNAPPRGRECYVCAAPGGKYCNSCKTRNYCSKACQRVDWRSGHSEMCKQLTADFRDKLLDELMPRKVKEVAAVVCAADVVGAPADEPAVLAAVEAPVPAASASAPAAGPEPAAAVGPALKPAALVKPTASWRGTCAICLHALPLGPAKTKFVECCCGRFCAECSETCLLYDKRCPLCRRLPCSSPAEGLKWLRGHVTDGQAEAQLELGDSYKDGRRGLQRSWKRAFRLYSAAAKQGHAAGMHLTGRCLDLGDGVVKDCKAAFRMHLNAADQGFPEAQCRLGLMMVEGRGTEKSYPAAVEWFQLAANQGQPDALYILGGCYANGEGLVKDFGLALRWLRKAANVGYAGADEAVCEIEAAARAAAAEAASDAPAADAPVVDALDADAPAADAPRRTCRRRTRRRDPRPRRPAHGETTSSRTAHTHLL